MQDERSHGRELASDDGHQWLMDDGLIQARKCEVGVDGADGWV